MRLGEEKWRLRRGEKSRLGEGENQAGRGRKEVKRTVS